MWCGSGCRKAFEDLQAYLEIPPKSSMARAQRRVILTSGRAKSMGVIINLFVISPLPTYGSQRLRLLICHQNQQYGNSLGSRRWCRGRSLLRTPPGTQHILQRSLTGRQGRAGLVALRRYRGGTSAMGKAFYKGGFEKTMNRREAALILEVSYVRPHQLSFKTT